jgi:hypothetical protein
VRRVSPFQARRGHVWSTANLFVFSKASSSLRALAGLGCQQCSSLRRGHSKGALASLVLQMECPPRTSLKVPY